MREEKVAGQNTKKNTYRTRSDFENEPMVGSLVNPPRAAIDQASHSEELRRCLRKSHDKNRKILRLQISQVVWMIFHGSMGQILNITGFCVILHAGQALDYLAAAHRSLCYLSSDVK